MDAFQGFPPVLAIFYSEFHPTQGPKVSFQVPENFLSSSTATAATANSSSLANPLPHHHSHSTLALAQQPPQQPQPPAATLPAMTHLMADATPTPANTPNFVALSPQGGDGSRGIREPSTTMKQRQQHHHHQETPHYHQHSTQATLDFDSISEYIIPKPALSNRLVTISTPHYKILSHPVTITSAKYERNALLFNVCFVFEKNAQTTVYEQVVRKLARTLRSLEVQTGFLSTSGSGSGAGSSSSSSDREHMNMQRKGSYAEENEMEWGKENAAEKATPTLGNILEQILEDLNSYAECQIPINSASMINLKLFPKYADPPPVHDYQVPVLIVNLSRVMDKHWDMTMRRIIPRINGVHSVRKIADLADVDPLLVRIAVQHLLYYGCVKIVDIFLFSNVYAVKSTITGLLYSKGLQKEVAGFVTKREQPTPTTLSTSGAAPNASTNQQMGHMVTTPPPFALLFSLYCALKPGLTVAEWIEENNVWDLHVDVRRFILFGLLHGFVYRIHKYPIWVARDSEPPSQQAPLPLTANSSTATISTAGLVAAPPPTPPTLHPQQQQQQPPQPVPNKTLKRFLDGTKHYDALCTMFNCSPRDLDEILEKDVPGSVRFVWK
ncbi:nitrogen permease regulator 2-domain-containing protein [Powellomyces hirtus]|nr:nitrogen permease regulator 2-domain-containing protein [Powellomyces hirtus]